MIVMVALILSLKMEAEETLWPSVFLDNIARFQLLYLDGFCLPSFPGSILSHSHLGKC